MHLITCCCRAHALFGNEPHTPPYILDLQIKFHNLEGHKFTSLPSNLAQIGGAQGHVYGGAVLNRCALQICTCVRVCVHVCEACVCHAFLVLVLVHVRACILVHVTMHARACMRTCVQSMRACILVHLTQGSRSCSKHKLSPDALL